MMIFKAIFKYLEQKETLNNYIFNHMTINQYYEDKWMRRKREKKDKLFADQWPERELCMFYESISKYLGKKILDIGSGDGTVLDYISRRRKVKKMVGLEISKIAIEQAKKKNNNVKYFLGSADDVYPFEKEYFDTLIMTDVIEHIMDINTMLSQCRLVVKREGKLIIVTPVFNLLKKIIIASFFWESFFHPTNQHIRFFTKKSMDLIMRKHGFKRIYYRWGLTWFGIMPQNAYFVYKKIKND